MKKNIKIGILLILSLVVIYFITFGIQNYSLKKTYRKNYISENDGGLVKSVLIRCNYNILDPEIADVYLTEANNLSISFHKPKKIFSANKQGWRDSYTGGTTVQNTTFENLLKMVQEDCYQFQKTFYQGDDNKLWWTYTKVRVKKTKSQEEIEQEKKEDEEYERKIKSGEIELDTRSIDELLEEIKNED